MFSSFYRFIHRTTGLVLQADERGNIHLKSFDKYNPYQLWSLFEATHTTTSIYNVGSKMSLDGYTDGENVQCSPDNANNPYQQWIRRASKEAPYHNFIHRKSGLYLDISEPDRVCLHPNKHGHPCQDWYLILLDETP